MNNDQTTLEKNVNLARSIYNSELTIEAFKSLYIEFKANGPELKEYLKTKNVKVLKSIIYQLGGYFDSRHKKDDLINKVYDNLKSYFYIGRSLCWTHGQDSKEVEEEMITGTTAEVLAKFYADLKEKREEKAKADANPETLKEFDLFIQNNGKEKLSPEQLETYERLKSDVVLANQKRQEERNAEIQKVDISTAEFKMHATKHSKTGADIFTVITTERVEKATFTELRNKAKKLGGYYSRYSDKNANPPILPGFNFETEESAKTFMGLKDQDQTSAPQREEKKEEVKQSAAERMRERAQNMIEKAEASKNQERRTNTHRQADQAGRAEAKAQNEIIFAKKLICIADGLENGSIKYLHALRNGAQLEQLERILNRGYSIRVPYSERNSKPQNVKEDVNFIRYPFPRYTVEVIHSVFNNHSETAGLKRDIKEIFKHSKRAADKNGFFELKHTHIIELYKRAASKLSDKWASSRILDSIKDFERIQKMGLVSIEILKTALRELAELGKDTGPSKEDIKAQELKTLERSFIGKKIPGFFPTPDTLIDTMFAMARVFEGETIREPSAGLGHIADKIQIMYPANELKVTECNYSLAEVLEQKGHEVKRGDFLEETEKADVFFMNPPFENHQDIDHVKHAFNLLNEGGRLVAIMAGNKTGSNSKIIEFNSFIEEFGYMQQNEAGSFKSAFNSTGVSTVIVYLEKPITTEEPKEEPQPEKEEEPKKSATPVQFIQGLLF